MKQIIPLVFVLCLHLNVKADSFISKEEYFYQILDDADSIIKIGTNKSEVLETNFNFVLEKVRQKLVQIKYDPSLPYGLSGCARSEIDGSTYKLLYGDFVLDIYKVFPYLSQGIIIHEFQHLYDFYQHAGLIEISVDNPIEKSYFEIDGLTLEALYFKNYTPTNAAVSPFEKYLSTDLDNGLAGTSTLFEKVDISLLHEMDEIRYKGIGYDSAMAEFVNIGKRLESKISYGDNAWKNYCQTVTLRTYVYYSKQVLHDILYVLKKVDYKSDELDIKKYPTFYNQVEKINKVYTSHEKDLEFQTKMIGQFDAFIKGKIK